MNRPEILYKYMPATYEAEPKAEGDYLKCLENGMVKYSSIADLNDPHEFMPFTFASNYHQGLKEDREKHLAYIDKMRVSRAQKRKLKAPVYARHHTLLGVIKPHDPEMDNRIYSELRKRREKSWGVFCLSDTWQSLEPVINLKSAVHQG